MFPYGVEANRGKILCAFGLCQVSQRHKTEGERRTLEGMHFPVERFSVPLGQRAFRCRQHLLA